MGQEEGVLHTGHCSDAAIRILAQLLETSTDSFTASQHWDMRRPVLDTPERKLWLAVLEQAVEDYVNFDDSMPCRYPARYQHDFESARAWLFENDKAEVSFGILCDAFDVDIDSVRAAIQAKRNAKERYQATKRSTEIVRPIRPATPRRLSNAA